MEKIKITNLPQHVISKIASLLPHQDVLKFRLTCTTFHDAVLCKIVLKTCKMKPKATSKWFFKFTEKIFGGRFVTLCLTSIKSEQLKKLLQSVPNLENIMINVQQLYCVKGACQILKSLSLLDKEVNFFMKMGQSKYTSYFDVLGELEIKELSIVGCGQMYLASLIKVIIQSARSIDTFTLKSLIINNSKEVEEFRHFLYSCNHIRNWELINVHITCKKGLQLPDKILSYKCIECKLSLLNKSHSCLEKLVFNGLIPFVDKIWKDNNFVNLKYLEFCKFYFYHSSLDKCSNLKILKLSNCHLPFIYLMNLSPVVKNTLQVLYLESYRDVNNGKLIKLTRAFTGLRELHLANMNEITPMFLYSIKHSSMKFIFISNCQRFKSTKHKEEILSMRDSFSFTVCLQDDTAHCGNAFYQF